MQRYILAIGVEGKPMAAHPSAKLGDRRFAGWARKTEAPASWESLADFYEPRAEVLPANPCAKAVKAGELQKLAGPLVSKDLAEAKAVLEGASAKSLKKLADAAAADKKVKG